MGAIAVLTEGDLGVRMVSQGCRIGTVRPADFRALAFSQESVHRRVMQRISPVMSRITALEQNRERLAALGTMAAGLAHELNNPAAAARRAAAQMAEALEVLSTTIERFVESGIERDDAEKLLELQREAMTRAAAQTALSSLDAADAEDALLDRLEEHDVPDAWKLVEPLVGAGLDADWVERVAAIAGPGTDARAALGRRRVSRRKASRASCRSRRGACRASSGLSSRTRTWIAATWSRSTCTRGSRRRSPSSATSSSRRPSRSCASTTARCRSSPCAGPS